MTIINEEKKYRKLKALQWWIVKELTLQKLTWLKKAKIGINEVIKCNEIVNNSLNHKYKTRFYFLKCRNDTENINPRVSNTSNGKTMTLSNCAICGSKKSKFIKNQEAKGLLSNLGLRTQLSKVTLLGDILF